MRRLPTWLRGAVWLVAAGVVGFALAHAFVAMHLVGRWFGEPLGGPCRIDNGCQSGACLLTTSPVFGVCAKPCENDGECQGERCVLKACVPRSSKVLGEACAQPWDCQDYLCLRKNEPTVVEPSGVCSQPCKPDRPCPPGYSCTLTTAGQQVGVCAPGLTEREIKGVVDQLKHTLTNESEEHRPRQ